MKRDNWFEVSAEGLRQLQGGKPKSFVARELIQNAWDEAEKIVKFSAAWDNGAATIIIEDDSAEGFRNLADAFTLFGPTQKRGDIKKRGRFNLGEKEVLALCKKAVIRTTKGGLLFDKGGRKSLARCKRERGTEVEVTVPMSRAEFNEMMESVHSYIVPEGIQFYFNERLMERPEALKSIEATLLTEILNDEVMTRTSRKATVNIYKPDGAARLYEMGIPVTDIDCDYTLDVQQKVPLSSDRETVPASYLKTLYAEVLNAMHSQITPESSSSVWVREATTSNRINSDAVRTVINNRYGEKAVIANPFDRLSIDDAIANGYRVVYGSEMSKGEWDNARRADVLRSSSDVFGHEIADSMPVEQTESMRVVAAFAKKIAKRCMSIDIQVHFAKWRGVAAQYGSRTLTFNVGALGNLFFNLPIQERTLDLIVHELGHEYGHHTEEAYHSTLTRLAAKLTFLAIREPEFFKEIK